MAGAPKQGKVVIINTDIYQIETSIKFDTGDIPDADSHTNSLKRHHWWSGLFSFIEIDDNNILISTPKFELYEIDNKFRRKLINENIINDDLMNFTKIEPFKYVCCIGKKLMILEYK